MQPENNELQPHTNNTPPQPQAQPWPPTTPESQAQSEVQPQTQTQPQPIAPPTPVGQPQQAQAQTSQPQQPAYDAQATNTQPTNEDPGKLFSILGIVGAFIMLQLPGLILSIIGYKKSKVTGHRTTLGTVGIWLNAIGLVLTTAVIAFIVWAAYAGIQQRAADTDLKSTAMSILQKAENYSANNSANQYAYPTIEQLRSAPAETALTEEESAKLKDTDQPTGDDIGYKTCTDSTGLIIGVKTYIYSDIFRRAIDHGSAGGICNNIN